MTTKHTPDYWIECYEISRSPLTDIPLEQQIAEGWNAWRAEDNQGAVAFGLSEQEARDNLAKVRS